MDNIWLTSLGDPITVQPQQEQQLTAVVSAELASANAAQLFVRYDNNSSQTVWQNSGPMSGSSSVGGTFTIPTAVEMRLAFDTTLTAGHLSYSDVQLATFLSGQITKRSSYSIAGQRIAVKVEGDPTPGNNGLFFVYTDHLGSTAVMRDETGTAVAGSLARYLPFGGYWGDAPTQNGDGREYTGQKENMGRGLMYYNGRYYLPGIGKFASADTLVPDPTNPQEYGRYSYVYNNPLRYTDPTGHCPAHSESCALSDGTGNNYSIVPTHRDKAIRFLQDNFVRPFAGSRSLTSAFGPSHPTGVDWGGQFTVLAPADGTVTFAGADGTAGMWRIQNVETGQIREWSVFSTATEDLPLYITDRDGNGQVEPERLLGTGEWIDLRPGWSHAPGTSVIIDHGNGIETVYHHLTIDVSITVGVYVNQGDVLGETANIGWSSGVHLHYGVKYFFPAGGWEWLNPLNPR